MTRCEEEAPALHADHSGRDGSPLPAACRTALGAGGPHPLTPGLLSSDPVPCCGLSPRGRV